MLRGTIICLLGLPGTGKGTQGQLLKSMIDHHYVAVGDLVRQIVSEGEIDAFHKEVIKRYNKGVPQPDKIINQLVKDKILSLEDGSGLILDAFPLSMGQVKGLDKLVKELDIRRFGVIFFDVPEQMIVTRLSRRKICSKCNNTFSGLNKNIECPCGGELITRSDDKPEVVQKRISEYKKRFVPIVSHYRDHGKLIGVDGSQSIAAVNAEMLDKLVDLGIVLRT